MTEAYGQDSDADAWQTKRPGEDTRDGSSRDAKREPAKYKNFWRKFAREVQEKQAKK